MWDDFLIGEPDSHNGAISVSRGSSLSQNSTHYWWNSSKFFVEGRIDKESNVGKYIKILLRSKLACDLETEICRLVINSISSDVIIKMIQRAEEHGKKTGIQIAQREIRKALGIRK